AHDVRERADLVEVRVAVERDAVLEREPLARLDLPRDLLERAHRATSARRGTASSRERGPPWTSARGSSMPYQELRRRGRKPAAAIMCSMRSMPSSFLQPAADTTFSSSIVPPKSLQPLSSVIWAIFMPCVTNDVWMFSKLSR